MNLNKKSVAFANDVDIQKRWKHFLKTIKDEILEFLFIIAEMKTLFEPVFDAIVNEKEWQRQWIAKQNE